MNKNIKEPFGMDPKRAYERLRCEVLDRIDMIDHCTPWQEVEPKWWLEMMELRRFMLIQSGNEWLAGDTSKGSSLMRPKHEKHDKQIQRAALEHAAHTVHSLSRGTKSQDRAAAIDEARDAILEEVNMIWMKTGNNPCNES